MEKTIYLAGGCFWGVEKYLSLVIGVTTTQVGYANGHTKNPTYEEVCGGGTGHAEAVRVDYDPDQLSLDALLEHFFNIIDPTAKNRQGADVGNQYRTGIYHVHPEDVGVAAESLAHLQKHFYETVVVENLPLTSYYPAEEYHQKYLDKNPGGYCHIPSSKFEEAGETPPGIK
ncbi:MAG: peptide-methionine (S)-S-oxide reductase MsrA [Defluviitaleaceae bacterium]|nr:peptide-methionine (S)-S-oxide reductase MsrA [Defluviitaleaceae bacterium]